MTQVTSGGGYGGVVGKLVLHVGCIRYLRGPGVPGYFLSWTPSGLALWSGLVPWSGLTV